MHARFPRRPGTAAAQIVLAALTAALPFPAAAASPPSGIYAFGDSAIEMGNLYLLPGLAPPAGSPYYSRDGWQRDSNGPVWVEYLVPSIRPVNAGPPFGPAVNFAHSGATTGREDAEYDLPVGVLSQVAGFEQAVRDRLIRPGPDALYVVEAGPNDLFKAMIDGTDITAAGRQSAANLGEAARRLAAAGARMVLVWDMPDVSQAPALTVGVPADQRPILRAALDGATAAARQALAAELGRVAAAAPAEATIVTVKLNSLFSHIRAHAAELGFRVIDRACIDPVTEIVCSADPAVQNQYLFFDGLHLTTRAQEMEARYYATLLDQLDGGANRRVARMADAGVLAAGMAADLGRDGLAQAPEAGIGLFAAGGWSRRGHPDGTATLTGGAGGLAYGDGEGWRLAVGVGALDGRMGFDAGGGFDLTGVLATAAGERRFADWFLTATVAAAWFDVDKATRPGGIPTLTLQADSQGEAHRLEIGGGYRLRLAGLTVTPALGAAWTTTEVEAFTERDGAGLEMAFDNLGRDGWSLAARLEVAPDVLDLAQGIRLRPQLAVSYERLLEAPETAVIGRLVDNTARPILARVADGDRDRVEVAPTLSLDFGSSATLAAGYTHRFGDTTEHRARLSAALRF
ncbi:MAG: hypothetical protein RLY86_1608 [Pseudomonadota bacterium]|jgi:phospholipase/lecithinase/hemolysin/uncharacterized protein YhjY with autotransporter beta-barrel domain